MSYQQTFIVEGHSCSVLSKLNEQRLDGSFCDVILQVEDTKLHVHRCVLAGCSDYFFKLFTIEMKEKYEGIVELKEVSLEAVKTLLDFLYTETIVLSQDSVFDILHAASLMQIGSALDVIASYLAKTMDTSNCLVIRKLGQMHQMCKLVSIADQFIVDHFEEMIAQAEFVDIECDALLKMLLSDNLKVKEETTVFETILDWVNKDVRERERYFSKLFKAVRLQHIPMKYVASRIRKDKFVRKFLDCRDLVEDAFLFHANPEMIEAEKPRKHFVLEPNSILCVHLNIGTAIFNVSNQSWIKQDFKGWKQNMVNLNCAVATKLPQTAFCGGLKAVNSESVPCKDVALFDGKSWSSLPSMIVARSGAAAVYFDDQLYVFGGEVNDIPDFCFSKEQFLGTRTIDDFAGDFETFSESWQVGGKLLSRRSFAKAEVIGRKIYLIGGYQFTQKSFPQNPKRFYSGGRNRAFCPLKVVCNSTDVFKLDKQTWTKGSTLNIRRADFGLASVESKIFVFGGKGVESSNLTDAEFLDHDSNLWTMIDATSPSSLLINLATFVKGRIFLCQMGGSELLSFDSETYQWSVEQGMPGFLIWIFCPMI